MAARPLAVVLPFMAPRTLVWYAPLTLVLMQPNTAGRLIALIASGALEPGRLAPAAHTIGLLMVSLRNGSVLTQLPPTRSGCDE